MFQSGKSGNSKGRTVEDRKRDNELAKLGQKIAGEWLEAIDTAISEAPTAEAKLITLRPDTLRLVESVQDRAWGKAKQAVDLSSEDGSASIPSVIQLVGPQAQE